MNPGAAFYNISQGTIREGTDDAFQTQGTVITDMQLSIPSSIRNQLLDQDSSDG